MTKKFAKKYISSAGIPLVGKVGEGHKDLTDLAIKVDETLEVQVGKVGEDPTKKGDEEHKI